MPDPPKKVPSEQKPEEAVVEREASDSSDERQPTPQADEEQSTPTPAETDTDATANERLPSASETSSSNANPSVPTPTSPSLDSSNAAESNADNDAAIAAIIADDIREFDSVAPVEARNELSLDPPPEQDQQQEPQQGQLVPSTVSPNQPAEPAISLLLVQEPSNETRTAPVTHDAEPAVLVPEVRLPVDHVYYFIQIFNVEKQVLQTVGAFFSRSDESIKAAIRKRLEWPDKKDFVIWQRVDGTTVTAVSAGETFGVWKADGVCFIVGDKLNKDKYVTSNHGSIRFRDKC